MRNESFSIKFYLAADKKPKNGLIPIYARITAYRKKVELSTRLHVSSQEEWNNALQRVATKGPANTDLNQMEAELRDIYNELKFNKKEISAQKIKNLYLGANKTSGSLLEYSQEFLNSMPARNPEGSLNTIKNYRTTLAHLKNFLLSQKSASITIGQFDEGMVKKFNTFLLSSTSINNKDQLLKRNTVNKYHLKLKVILNAAIDENLIQKSPYAHFKLKSEPGTRTFLTAPELSKIEDLDLSGNIRLEQARDIFLFSVYTGLRFSDAISLKGDNIEYDGKKYWIVYQQQKTKEHNRIPMLNKTKVLYDKYAHQRERTGFALPRMVNQNVNGYLKVIAGMGGLNKLLTHHVARHTNATTIMLANGIPLEVVSRQLGHKSIKTTQIYAKITNDLLANAADKLDSILR